MWVMPECNKWHKVCLDIHIGKLQTRIEILNFVVYGKFQPKTNQGSWHVNMDIKPIQVCQLCQNMMNGESLIYIGGLQM